MTKIMARTGALGNLIDFRLLADQAHELRGSAALIAALSGGLRKPTYCGRITSSVIVANNPLLLWATSQGLPGIWIRSIPQM